MIENRINVIERKAAKPNGKPPLLFVHGAWHGAWCWDEHFLQHFAGLGFDAYALDLRGHGDSKPVKSMRWNRIRDYAADVTAVVDSLDQKPVLIGHSMGGYTVQNCFAHEDRLAGAVLMATVPHYGAIKAALHVAVHTPLTFLKTNLSLSLYPIVADREAAGHLFLDEGVDEETRDAFAAKLIDESYLGFLDMLLFALPRHKPQTIPVGVIGAAKDVLFSPASQEATAQRYGGDCRIIADAPHDLMLGKRWKASADALTDWLESRVF